MGGHSGQIYSRDACMPYAIWNRSKRAKLPIPISSPDWNPSSTRCWRYSNRKNTCRKVSQILHFNQEKSIEDFVELGDIPEEFLDPILSTLMVDPVVLPASGITMERAVICRHLLSARTDPFCREPLTPDMLKPSS